MTTIFSVFVPREKRKKGTTLEYFFNLLREFCNVDDFVSNIHKRSRPHSAFRYPVKYVISTVESSTEVDADIHNVMDGPDSIVCCVMPCLYNMICFTDNWFCVKKVHRKTHTFLFYSFVYFFKLIHWLIDWLIDWLINLEHLFHFFGSF